MTAWVRAISGRQDQDLGARVGGERRCGNLQINLGLSRAGNPVQQGDTEARPQPSMDFSCSRGGGLARIEARAWALGVWRIELRHGLDKPHGQDAVIDQAFHHARAHA